MHQDGVFSAQAEVFLKLHEEGFKDECFLRASGGVSQVAKRFGRSLRVFSAQAEVFPDLHQDFTLQKGFLRASGGVSNCRSSKIRHIKFSPRKRRCFRINHDKKGNGKVFSAQAEVFL